MSTDYKRDAEKLNEARRILLQMDIEPMALVCWAAAKALPADLEETLEGDEEMSASDFGVFDELLAQRESDDGASANIYYDGVWEAAEALYPQQVCWPIIKD